MENIVSFFNRGHAYYAVEKEFSISDGGVPIASYCLLKGTMLCLPAALSSEVMPPPEIVKKLYR
eukprot:scaffold5048_cov82-Cyclotella_meneghiniana.AAC.3